MYKPIQFQDLGLHFTHKTCLSDFSEKIRVSFIDRNEPGKSTLFKILPLNLHQGYLPTHNLFDTTYLIEKGSILYV